MKFEFLAALIFQFGVIAYLATNVLDVSDESSPLNRLRRYIWVWPLVGLVAMVFGGGGDARNPLIFEQGTLLLIGALAARDARARGMDGWRKTYLGGLTLLTVLLWLGGRYQLTDGAAFFSGLSLETWVVAAVLLIFAPIFAYPFVRKPRLDRGAPTVTAVGGLMGNSAESIYMALPRVIIGIIIIVGIVVNAANVVGRYVYLAPIIWAEEIMIYSMVWTVFAGSILVTWDGRHLKMDLLSASLKGTPRLIVGTFIVTVFLATIVIVAFQNWDVFLKMVQLDQRSVVAEIPMAIPHFALLFGFVLMGLAILVRLRRHIYGEFEGEVEGLVKEYGE